MPEQGVTQYNVLLSSAKVFCGELKYLADVNDMQFYGTGPNQLAGESSVEIAQEMGEGLCSGCCDLHCPQYRVILVR